MESWSSHVQEGFLPVDGYRVWYRIVGGSGDHEGYPLMILHGGPGVPHDYLENLEALASDTRQVVFYDQLGCGRSDQPDDPSLWRVSRFADELTTVRQALGLDQVPRHGCNQRLGPYRQACRDSCSHVNSFGTL